MIGRWLCRHGIHSWRFREQWISGRGAVYHEQACRRCDIRGHVRVDV